MATDSFTYANGVLQTVSSGVWARVTSEFDGGGGGMAVDTNTLRASTAGNSFGGARYDTSIGAVDHYSQIEITHLSASSYAELGVATRVGTGASFSGFYAYVANDGSAGLHRVDGGSFSAAFDSASGLTVSGTHELRMESAGSTHTVYWDDVEIMSGSDSAYASNTHVGLGGYMDADDMQAGDNWAGNDLSASTNADVTAIVVPVTFENPTPTVTISAQATPSTVDVLFAEPPPSVTAGGGASVSPAVVEVAFAPVVPALNIGVTIIPPVVTVGITILSPVLVDPPWPTSISGRKILDQNGDVYLLPTFSSWSLADLSAVNITTALEGMALRRFHGVTVWSGGGYRLDGTWDPKYSTKELLTGGAGNEAWWTGTPWQSTFGPAWNHMDHVASECARLGLTLSFSFCGGNGDTGARPDWQAASNAQMQTVGVTIANRYAAYPNIVWHVMFDDVISGDTADRINALFAGIQSVEGTARPVRWTETRNGVSTYSDLISGNTIPNFGPSMNGFYDNGFGSAVAGNSVELVEASYNEAGATSLPTGDQEPFYDSSPLIPTEMGQQLRERALAVFIEGGSYINWSHEDWWPFGKSGWIASVEGITWPDVINHVHTVQASYIWALLDVVVAVPSWVPDGGTFLTSGVGSGNTKAAAGFSSNAAMAYFPNSRSIIVNTTVIEGTGQVQLRWWDPTADTFTTISAAEAQNASRAVTYPGNNSAGAQDWVLLVNGVAAPVAVETTVPFEVLTPTVSTSGQDVLVGATVVTVAFSEPAPAISTGVTVTPVVPEVVFTEPVPQVQAGGDAVVSAPVVTVVFSEPAPAAVGGAAAVEPSTPEVVLALPAPAVSTSVNVLASVVTVVMQALLPVLIGDPVTLPRHRCPPSSWG